MAKNSAQELAGIGPLPSSSEEKRESQHAVSENEPRRSQSAQGTDHDDLKWAMMPASLPPWYARCPLFGTPTDQRPQRWFASVPARITE